jgi:cytochrome c553
MLSGASAYLRQERTMKKISCRVVTMFALAAGVSGMASCEGLSHRDGAQSTAVTRGEQIYWKNCIGCHAPRGTGDSFLAVPALAGQRRQYLQDQLERFSTDKRHSSQMQWAFKRVSVDTPQAAADVATYLSSLPGQRFVESNPRLQAEGQANFVAHCASCHGADVRGSSDGAIPLLRAQHDSYLENRLRRFASASPTVMISAHVIDEHTIIAVAAYLSSLRGMPIETDPSLDR